MTKLKIIIIAAVSENNVIGKDGSIPWYSKEEITHFKQTTNNYPILMGRKTFASLKSPLSNRTNLILSRDSKFGIIDENVFTFRSIGDVYDFSKNNNFTKLFVIGGGEIYSQLINKADELLLSRMPFIVDGDTYFPEIDTGIWKLRSKKDFKSFTLEKYVRN